MVKGMRGLGRWAMVAWSSDRSEVVLQVVAERNIARVDNAFASWRRIIARAFGVEVKRGVWLAGYFADVRLGDVFEVACAEAWAKAAVDAGALRCSSEEPALPEALAQALAQARRRETGINNKVVHLKRSAGRGVARSGAGGETC